MVGLLEYLQQHEDAFKSRNRLASLYSDFHLRRATNPEGYAANAGAWISALNGLATAGLLPSKGTTSGSSVSFTAGDDLLRALSSPQFGQPLALGAVISEAVQNGDIIPLDRFQHSEKSIYHKSWLNISIPGPAQVLGWGLRQLGLSGSTSSDRLMSGDFVLMRALEQTAAIVSSAIAAQPITNLTDRIYPRAMFESAINSSLTHDEPLSTNDFTLLLTYLSRDKPQLTFSGTTIKLRSSPSSVTEPLTAEDESIAKLRALISSLTNQIADLETRSQELITSAKTAVSVSQLTRAKQLLRQRRAIDATLSQRTSALETLERTWTAIGAAADNVAMTSAMREGAAVLRSLNAQVGGAEGVESVVDALNEQVDIVGEVSAVMDSAAYAGKDAVDEGEVEEELEALERESKEKEERERKDAEAKKSAMEEESVRKRLEELDVPTAEVQATPQRDGASRAEAA